MFKNTKRRGNFYSSVNFKTASKNKTTIFTLLDPYFRLCKDVRKKNKEKAHSCQ